MTSAKIQRKNTFLTWRISIAIGLTLFTGLNATASYNVSTIAGSAVSFSGDGAIATAARLNNPFGVFVHSSSGDTYFADTANNRIGKITASTGFISTIAGTGTAGSTGDSALASSALLNSPRSIFVDNLRNVYIADTSNNRVRMVVGTAGTYFGSSRTEADIGKIYTIAGTGTAGSTGDSALASSALLNNPWGVFVDSTNNLYIADSTNNRIRMVVGTAGTYFGSSRTANFIYTIAGGSVTTAGFAGDGASATAASVRLNSPRSIFVDNLRNVYIADTTNNRIRMVVGTAGTYFGSSRTANFIYTIAGGSVTNSGFAGDGGSATTTSVRLSSPQGVFVDSSKNVYIADSTNNRVRMVVGTAGTYFGSSRTANFIYTIAGTGTAGFLEGSATSTAMLSAPQGVFVNSTGDVYIADGSNDRIRMLTASSNGISTIAGSALRSSAYADGVATSARFINPGMLSINLSTGDLLVPGSDNNVRKVTTAGGVYTVSTLFNYNVGSTPVQAVCAYITSAGASILTTDNYSHLYQWTLSGGRYVSNNSLDAVSSPAGAGDGYGLVIDSSNNIFMTDSQTHRIFKILPSGSYSIFAGSGSSGGADGTGAAASFNGITGVTIDSSNNLYASDTGNNLIRKITPAGVVTTIAGSTRRSVDGVGTSARFINPGMLSIDLSTGDLLVPGSDNNVRKVTTAGDVYTVSTLFQGSAYYTMEAVCQYITTTGTSTILSTDSFAHLYQWILSGGTYVSNTSLNAVSSPAYAGWGLVADSNKNIYMTDSTKHIIYKIQPSGTYSVFAGTYGASGATDGTQTGAGSNSTSGSGSKFNGITGVTIDSSNNLYASDTTNNTIRKITPAGVVTTIAGTAGSSGSTDAAGSSARFNSPWDIDIDGSGNLYIADRGNNLIRKLTLSGATYTASTIAGTAGLSGSTDGTGAAARFNAPTGISVDSSGIIYVSDTNNDTIRKITSGGVVTTVAGLAGVTSAPGSTDAIGTAAKFNSPWDIDIDSSGNLYVADRGNNLIRKLTNNSGTYTVSTIAGTAGSSGSADGIGAAARFNAPTGLAVSASGALFVTDTGNNTIRKILLNSPYSIASGGSTNLSGSATGRAYITGGGTAVLPPSNAYDDVELSNGILQVSSSAVPVTFNASGGAATLSITSAAALGPLTFTSAGNVQIGSSITATIASPPVGSGTMTLTGGGILQAQVDLSSSTTPVAVSEGILEVSGTGRLPNAATSVASGATLQLGTSGGTVAAGAVANASVASGGIMSILAGATGALTTATIASGGIVSVAAGVTAPSGMFTSATFRSGGILQVGDGATLGQSFTSVP